MTSVQGATELTSIHYGILGCLMILGISCLVWLTEEAAFCEIEHGLCACTER